MTAAMPLKAASKFAYLLVEPTSHASPAKAVQAVVAAVTKHLHVPVSAEVWQVWNEVRSVEVGSHAKCSHSSWSSCA